MTIWVTLPEEFTPAQAAVALKTWADQNAPRTIEGRWRKNEVVITCRTPLADVKSIFADLN